MTDIKVVALDPGGTTGYVTGVISDGKLGVVSGQAVWVEIDLWNQLHLVNPDVIVYERFEYRSESAYGRHGNLSNVDLFPRNLIGVINLYEQAIKDRVKLYPQMPGAVLGKNAYWSDDKLKTRNVYKTGKPHANDAMRHMLYWWTFGAGFKYNTNGFEPLA